MDDVKNQNQGITLVPEGYKPTQFAGVFKREKNEREMQPWVRNPRTIPEFEKQVPKRYRPNEDIVKDASIDNGKCTSFEGGFRMASRSDQPSIELVLRKFETCLGSSSMAEETMLQKLIR